MRRHGFTSSVGVLPGGLDDGAPLGEFGFDKLLVVGRVDAGVGDDDGAKCLLALDELGVLERGAQGRVDLIDDRLGRALGRIQAVPDRDVRRARVCMFRKSIACLTSSSRCRE